MTLSDLAGTRVLLLGFGGANKAFYAAARAAHPRLSLTIADTQSVALPADPHIQDLTGSDAYLQELERFDVIVRTPGHPYGPELDLVRDRITTPTNLFFATVRASTTARFIGITGTKGKSTTSTLIHALLQEADVPSHLVGNIGNHDWDALPKIQDGDWIVYELSSYMLEDFASYPDIAIITSLFPDHLDWHGGRERYHHAKAQITARQSASDSLVYHARFPELAALAKRTDARTLAVGTPQGFHWQQDTFYKADAELFQLAHMPFPGDHNKDNLLFACAVADLLELDQACIPAMLAHVAPLPHRLQAIATVNDVLYVDDSISTTPESTMAAIASFDRVGSIVLGGLDRGYDYSGLAEAVQTADIPHVVLLPGGRQKLTRALQSAGYTGQIHTADQMPDVVATLAAHTPPNTVALFSTAAPSYDQYKNYQDQGDQFQEAVHAL